MKRERRDLDVGVESIFVEQESTPAVVSHMEAVRQKVVLEVLDGFLQRDDVPFPRNVTFNSSCFSTSRTRFSTFDAEPRLFS